MVVWSIANIFGKFSNENCYIFKVTFTNNYYNYTALPEFRAISTVQHIPLTNPATAVASSGKNPRKPGPLSFCSLGHPCQWYPA